MAQRENDELADALAALAAGQAVPSEHSPDDTGAHHAPPAEQPTAPAPSSAKVSRSSDPTKNVTSTRSNNAALPNSQTPGTQVSPSKPATPARPAAPGQAPVTSDAKRPSTPPPPVSKNRPNAPARAAAPSAPPEPPASTTSVPTSPSRDTRAASPTAGRPAPPTAPPPVRPRAPGPARPAAPGLPNLTPPLATTPQPQADEAIYESDANADAQQEAEDDASVIAPAAPIESLASTRKYVRPKVVPVYQTLAFRRTIIPICLTLGAALPILAVLTLVRGEETTIGAFPRWFTFVLAGVGLLMGGLAFITMSQVKNELAGKTK